MKQLALPLLVLGLAAATAAAQSAGGASGQYDPTAEVSYSGIVTAVIPVVGADGTVGVHFNLKTSTGTIVKVEVGPAMFIGMNDFSFLMDDLIAVQGAWVSHDGDLALWARQVSKGSKTLVLRNADGMPRWPLATAEDPDGCGVSHAPVRY
jgi:hypothetical protein